MGGDAEEAGGDALQSGGDKRAWASQGKLSACHSKMAIAEELACPSTGGIIMGDTS